MGLFKRLFVGKTQDTSEVLDVDVFISHAGMDRKIAARLASALKKRGIDVWVDPEPLIYGHTPFESVLKAVSSCRVVLPLCSHATMSPTWEVTEMDVYRNPLYWRRGLRVIPIRVENCKIPPEFSGHMWFDLFRGEFNERVDDLTEQIKGILAHRLVFICHSSRDKEVVQPVVKALRAHVNIDLWYDEQSLKAGSVIRRDIESGIAAADYLVVVLSKNSIDTIEGWIGFELDQAYEKERARNEVGHYFAIPVLIEDDLKIPGWLGTKLYVRLTTDFDNGIKKIIDALSIKPPSIDAT